MHLMGEVSLGKYESQSERSMNYENEKSSVSVSMVSTSHVLPTMCETDSALT